MQRNTLFGGLALMLAGGLIGAGAMISSNAMADTADAPPTNGLTMINVGPDGGAVKCTFEGADVEGMLPVLPSTAPVGALPADGTSGIVVSVAGAGDGPSFSIGSPPEGVVVGSGTITVDGSTPPGDLPVFTSGVVAPEGLADGATIISSDDAREGTPEECAAMREGAVAMATATPAQVITGTATADAGGSATKP